MSGKVTKSQLAGLFTRDVEFRDNVVILSHENPSDHDQTKDSFAFKWKKVAEIGDRDASFEFQKKWYLDLYGFETEDELAGFLATKQFVFDAGCGMGYKAAWFAELSPSTTVVGMDFSDSVYQAASEYERLSNLVFVQGDIADTSIEGDRFDYVSCDQVIMHTEDPDATFRELTRITRPGGEFACYVYARKALPRELLDDHFRSYTKGLSHEQILEMAEQLTDLGKRLGELGVSVDVPEIPLLGIKGGVYDIQRFIYWNFLKCFWNAELGRDISVMTNFDWYSPTNARRYSKEEFLELIDRHGLQTKHFHEEPACYSGRFAKRG